MAATARIGLHCSLGCLLGPCGFAFSSNLTFRNQGCKAIFRYGGKVMGMLNFCGSYQGYYRRPRERNKEWWPPCLLSRPLLVVLLSLASSNGAYLGCLEASLV